MAEAAIDRAEPAALERGSLRSLLAIGGGPVPGRADVAILGYVGALLVLWSPAFYLGLLTPRIAIVLVGLGPGLAVVFGLARRGDRASWWLLGWLAWAALAALASSSPRLSLLGVYGIDSGWIYLAGYVGAWGLGRRLRPSSRPLLGRIVFAGLAVNMAFAVLEVVIDPSGDLATNAGRAAGLQTNSLYLAGLLTGLLAMLARSVGRGAPRWRLALVVPTALALNLTGSRTALVGGTVIAVAAVALPGSGTALDRPERLLRTLAVVVGVGLGVLISLPLQGEASTVVRLEGNEASGGMRNRVLMWEAGVEALDERPLVGWGPGRFREATSSRITAEFARLEGPEKVFFDAHNVVVEQLVTTGVVGAALLGGFVVLAVLRARGPLPGSPRASPSRGSRTRSRCAAPRWRSCCWAQRGREGPRPSRPRRARCRSAAGSARGCARSAWWRAWSCSWPTRRSTPGSPTSTRHRSIAHAPPPRRPHGHRAAGRGARGRRDRGSHGSQPEGGDRRGAGRRGRRPVAVIVVEPARRVRVAAR
ncbi:MAG: O-antigen ligase family protein [Acidimicrobiales bacterium]